MIYFHFKNLYFKAVIFINDSNDLPLFGMYNESIIMDKSMEIEAFLDSTISQFDKILEQGKKN